MTLLLLAWGRTSWALSLARALGIPAVPLSSSIHDIAGALLPVSEGLWPALAPQGIRKHQRGACPSTQSIVASLPSSQGGCMVSARSLHALLPPAERLIADPVRQANLVPQLCAQLRQEDTTSGAARQTVQALSLFFQDHPVQVPAGPDACTRWHSCSSSGRGHAGAADGGGPQPRGDAPALAAQAEQRLCQRAAAPAPDQAGAAGALPALPLSCCTAWSVCLLRHTRAQHSCTCTLCTCSDAS